MSEQHSTTGVVRRDVIKAGGATAAALALGTVAATTVASPADASRRRIRLAFGRDRKFKIVQFNDTQDDELIDRRTIELMEKVLDSEKPDFVILNGDNITEGCDSALEMKQAMNNIAQPMEQRNIPWAMTFGNHDEDSTPKSGLDEDAQLAFYRRYKTNVNEPSPAGVTGSGNCAIAIRGSRTSRAVFNLFLLDSGRYAPKTLAGQDFEGYPAWDWLRMNQIAWYTQTSKEIERRWRRRVPSLLFIHIPLWEYRFMWWGGVDTRTEESRQLGAQRHRIEGERNEAESPGPFNSGLFSAIVDRGDVKGVFCGHDHVNTYVGNYYGVMLGYAGNTGFGTYGLDGPERNRLRGARVFNLTETDAPGDHDGVQIETHMVFAKDFGMDLTANDQPIDPAPLPPGW